MLNKKINLSEVSCVLPNISTYCTAQHFLLSIQPVITSNRTFSWSLTFWQLIFCIFRYIISITLPFMTWLTKMSVTPAEPLSYWTAKFTFKLYKVISMLRTILNWNITTTWTNKLFRIKALSILSIIHNFSTILTPSKIRFFTFKTHKICIYGHGIIFRFIIVKGILIS